MKRIRAIADYLLRRRVAAAIGVLVALFTFVDQDLTRARADSASIASPSGDSQALRILTCNIRLPLAEDEATGNGWAERRQLCADTIAAEQADVICLQECREKQLRFLLKQLDGFDASGLGKPDLDFERTNPILFARDRFRLVTSGGFWLSKTPHVEDSVSWDSARPRFANWVQLRDRTTGRQLRIWNTHLDHVGQTAREQQAALIVAASQALPPQLTQILAADLNADVNNKAVDVLTSGGWRDTYAVVHGPNDPGFTFHRFLGPAYGSKSNQKGKIDWIFCRGDVQPAAAEIVRTGRNGHYPSDHYFVSATLKLSSP